MEESGTALAAKKRRLEREMGDVGVCFVNADVKMRSDADRILGNGSLRYPYGDLRVVEEEIVRNG